MPNIIFTGTESTYKTVLSSGLAEEYSWPLCPEFARVYLESDRFRNLGIALEALPLEQWEYIARQQLEQQERLGYFSPSNERISLFDTDGLTLYLWGEDKYNVQRRQLLEVPRGSLYLLCVPTNAADEDPLRMDTERRWELHERYLALLNQLELNYVLLDAADLATRKVQLRAALADLLPK